MAHAVADRVRETSITTGTGTFSLKGRFLRSVSFVSGVANTNTCDYLIINREINEWEGGRGTVTDGTPDTLSRTTIFASSNAGSVVNFSAGMKDVYCVQSASPMMNLGTTKYTKSATAPVSPTTNDRWFETGTQIEWFWNGTYWLSMHLFRTRFYVSNYAFGYITFIPCELDQATQHDLFFVDLCSVIYVASGNDSTNYWGHQFSGLRLNGAVIQIATHNISGLANTTFHLVKTLIDVHRDLSVATQIAALYNQAVKTLSPGNFTGATSSTYRWAHL